MEKSEPERDGPKLEEVGLENGASEGQGKADATTWNGGK